MKQITDVVWELAEPVVQEHGCQLWDVEYVREAGQWYLRLYLDKDGGVDILDCENVSRRVSDLLDQADPIEGSYVFEVSSAGAERPLKRPSDFQQFMGSPVLLKTYKPAANVTGVAVVQNISSKCLTEHDFYVRAVFDTMQISGCCAIAGWQ